MRQAASYRAAAADCLMTDQWQSGRQQRHIICDGLGFLGDVVPRHGANRYPAVCRRHSGQLIDAVDVDEHLRAGQPQRQQRYQALAAGEHARIVEVLSQHIDSFRNGRRRLVLNRRQLHWRGPSIAGDSSLTRQGSLVTLTTMTAETINTEAGSP